MCICPSVPDMSGGSRHAYVWGFPMCPGYLTCLGIPDVHMSGVPVHMFREPDVSMSGVPTCICPGYPTCICPGY